MVPNFQNGLIWSYFVQNGSNHLKKNQNGLKGSKKRTKSSNMVNKILKIFHKTTAVSAAVEVTAVKSNLKF